MNSVVVDRNYSRLQRRRTVVYVFLCVICELLGLGLVFLQLYGAHRIDERYRFWMSSSFGKSMRRYAFCLPLSTGLLVRSFLIRLWQSWFSGYTTGSHQLGSRLWWDRGGY
ncbi:uncharacterized protein LOC134182576 isoform X2 [Corticium candelabrum]|uniref:uncharacterized protein LOC134182576 isoform X2 n=1 Tax=Corticium candelabrum TaxID=121492 RepID=UPI002E262302|nr:uncharacterized protein LOC134182576 isoform X2 [Corticium candelabrum]